MKGVVESSGDKFLVSFSGNDKKIAEKVNITFKVSGTIKTLEKQMGANEMVLSLSKMNDLKASSNYELCLKTPKGLSVTLIQSSPIIYFPEK